MTNRDDKLHSLVLFCESHHWALLRFFRREIVAEKTEMFVCSIIFKTVAPFRSSEAYNMWFCRNTLTSPSSLLRPWIRLSDATAAVDKPSVRLLLCPSTTSSGDNCMTFLIVICFESFTTGSQQKDRQEALSAFISLSLRMNGCTYHKLNNASQCPWDG